MGIAELIKDYGPAVAWLVAGIGWTISNNQANTREKRKEFRAEIDAAEKIVKSVVENASTYYKAQSRDNETQLLELDIKLLFEELSSKWERLKKRKFVAASIECSDAAEYALEAFYDHVTGEYFESDTRLTGEGLNGMLQKNNLLAIRFIESLHKLFLREFDKLP
jgi:hypothetical protein